MIFKLNKIHGLCIFFIFYPPGGFSSIKSNTQQREIKRGIEREIEIFLSPVISVHYKTDQRLFSWFCTMMT